MLRSFGLWEMKRSAIKHTKKEPCFFYPSIQYVVNCFLTLENFFDCPIRSCETSFLGQFSSCPECGKSFMSSQHLTQYRKIHLHYNECDQCDFKCARKDHSAIHKQSTHKGVTLDCCICNLKPKRKYILKTNKQSVHEGVSFNSRFPTVLKSP